jgi:demethoxyubiquinone hydroxylase (CLK1/Coq7/Cat5 family)
MAIADSKSNKNVDQLNSFLRGERSAVDAYRKALDQIEDTPIRAQLQACLESHQKRVETLVSRISSLGGQPSEGAGAWGLVTGAIASAASAVGEKAAISALESGEDHGLADYKRDIQDLTVDLRGLVISELLPAQEFTHARMSELKHALKA